jgi:hypothetical protein
MVTPLEARAALVVLLKTRPLAPRPQIEHAADVYIAAIKRQAKATGRRLPVPTRAGIIRLLS